MKKLLVLASFLLAGVSCALAQEKADWLTTGRQPSFLSSGFEEPVSADVFSVAEVIADTNATRMVGRIEEGNYLYRKSISVEDASGKRVQVELSKGTTHDDPYFGSTEIYEGSELTLSVPLATVGPLNVHWQGCAKDGVCFPPKVLKVALGASSSSSSVAGGARASVLEAPVQTSPSAQPQALAGDEAAAQRLETLGPILGPLLFFGFGLLLAFTPCSLPMVPIVASMVTGGATPRRAAALACSYVLAMALTYAVIGVLAGLAGANLQAALQTPWLLCALAVLFSVLAASLFGAFELRLPSWLMDKLQGNSSGNKGGLAGAFALGLISALMVGPCMTAPLAGALLYIGQSGSALRGGTALFMLGLGMGVPLILIAAFGAKVLPRPGAWMERVRVVFGYVMLALAVEMVTRFLPGNVALGLWGAWGLGVAVGFVTWSRSVGTAGLRPLLGFSGALSGLWAVFLLIGAASGNTSLANPLKQERQLGIAAHAGTSMVSVKTIQDVESKVAVAGAQGQWTLVDFYADWCTSCHHNERSVFGDEEVQKVLSQMQVLRPDVTANDAEDQALMRSLGVQGPPTLLFIGPDGRERRAQRSVGETSASEFLERLSAARSS